MYGHTMHYIAGLTSSGIGVGISGLVEFVGRAGAAVVKCSSFEYIGCGVALTLAL